MTHHDTQRSHQRPSIAKTYSFTGNIEALEFLYTQPQIAIDGVIPNPEPTTGNKKKQKPWKKRNQYRETLSYDKLPERRRTPLHHACIGHQLESVKFFVSNGANINIQDNDGDTPLLAVLKEAVRSKNFNAFFFQYFYCNKCHPVNTSNN